MFGLAPGNLGCDAKPLEESASPIVVIAAVRIKFIRMFFGTARFAADDREVDDNRNEFHLIAAIGRRRVDRERHAVAINQDGVFGAEFSAVNGARTGFFAAAERAEDDAVDDDRFRVEFVGSAQ